MPPSQPLRIAHFRREWLPPREVFIAETVAHHRGPQILLARSILPGNRFPLPEFTHTLPRKKTWDLRYTWTRTMASGEADYWTKLLINERIDLIHAHFGLDGAYFLPPARNARIPLVATFYGYDACVLPKYYGGLGLWMLRKLFREATLLRVASQDMRNDLLNLGAPARKVEVLHFGTSVTKFPFQERRYQDGPVQVVMVCGFTEKKGVEYLIRALALLKEKSPGFKATLAGDGPERPRLLKLTQDLGLSGQVTFPGFLSNEDVGKLLQSAHIFAHPSVTAANGDKEGVPTAIMEAMCSGLPVVATTHAGIPELVEHGISGLLVPERDPKKLAEALMELAANPFRWPEMGTLGRRRVAQQFNVEHLAGDLEDFYRRALDRFRAS